MAHAISAQAHRDTKAMQEPNIHRIAFFIKLLVDITNMQIKLLGQGFKPSSSHSVGQELIKFLADKDFHTFTGISAFASQAGVTGLSKHISNAKKHLNVIAIVTGIDQKGTSKEALEALLDLKVETYVFYQPSITIFHPKVYLFEGDTKSKLILGSANLTSQGLFTNVEASLLVSIDNSNKGDQEIIKQLKEYFSGIFDRTDPNLKKLTKQLIGDLVRSRIVPTEAERKAIQDKAEKIENITTVSLISKIFPKRAIAQIPSEFRGVRKSTVKTKTVAKPTTANAPNKGLLIWTRRKIPRSSVQRSTGNPTGGLRLVQDKFTVNGKIIDQTDYFRNEVFSNFSWKTIKGTPFVEVAAPKFIVTIKGKTYGPLSLEVRHKPSGAAGQGNYTTSISWGDLGEVIAKENLTGLRLDLFAPKSKGKPFQIAIS